MASPMCRASACLFACLLTSCAAGEDVGKADFALSQPGPWDIPADVAAIGDTQHIDYTGAGPWVGTDGCGGGLLTGTGRLRDWMATAFPQVTGIGGYSCRHINGDSTRMSVHATGRALDISIPLHSGEADNDLGDPVGNWLIEHAEEIGIQYIIWDRWTWNASRTAGSKERLYGGAHPHHDHLHIELSIEAGAATTPWFSGAMTPPDTDCPALGPDGGTVEETSECFSLYGPAAYWRSESVGHGGSLLWTNAFENDSPSNWARWHLAVEEGGQYTVEIYAQQPFAAHRTTRYELRHGDVETAIEVDLAGAMGWVRLGEFTFAPGGGQHLSVYDNSPVPVASDQRIPADAIRLVRADTTPGPDPGPDPDPGSDSRVIDVYEIAPIDVGPIFGGDPTLDDDPMSPGRTSVSGCSVGSGSSSSSWLLALLVGFAFVRRRRCAPDER